MQIWERKSASVEMLENGEVQIAVDEECRSYSPEDWLRIAKLYELICEAAPAMRSEEPEEFSGHFATLGEVIDRCRPYLREIAYSDDPMVLINQIGDQLQEAQEKLNPTPLLTR